MRKLVRFQKTRIEQSAFGQGCSVSLHSTHANLLVEETLMFTKMSESRLVPKNNPLKRIHAELVQCLPKNFIGTGQLISSRYVHFGDLMTDYSFSINKQITGAASVHFVLRNFENCLEIYIYICIKYVQIKISIVLDIFPR